MRLSLPVVAGLAALLGTNSGARSDIGPLVREDLRQCTGIQQVPGILRGELQVALHVDIAVVANRWGIDGASARASFSIPELLIAVTDQATWRTAVGTPGEWLGTLDQGLARASFAFQLAPEHVRAEPYDVWHSRECEYQSYIDGLRFDRVLVYQEYFHSLVIREEE